MFHVEGLIAEQSGQLLEELKGENINERFT